MSYRVADLPEQIRFMRTRRAKLVKQQYGHAKDLGQQAELIQKLRVVDDVIDSLIQLKRIKTSRTQERVEAERKSVTNGAP